MTTYVVNLPGSDRRPEGTRHYDELYRAEDNGEITPTDADDTAVLLYTSDGGTIVLVPRFEVEPVLDAVERHRCTIFSGVPTMYFALLQADLSGRDLSSLRVGVSGGAAIPGEVIRAFEEKFPGVVILEGYRDAGQGFAVQGGGGEIVKASARP